ncbi:MAG: DUF1178 family protein [Pseudomonadota bacterium]
MIKYTLQCSSNHQFESWFNSSAAFDKLAKAGQIDCPHCGDTSIEKALMAPAVSTTKGEELATFTTDTTPASPAEAAARAMLEAARSIRKKLENEADYVGKDFANKARERHQKSDDEQASESTDTPASDKPIWGEASVEEARDLIDDGIAVVPVPKLPEDEN